MRRTLSFLFSFMFLSVWVQAQQLDLQQLQLNGQFSENLLGSRSVVLIRSLEAAPNAKVEPWKELANKAHPFLKEMGIDAVAYYDWRNVNAGPDATKAFAQAFRQRDIRNVVVLEQSENELRLTLAPIGEEGMLKAGAPAWQQSGEQVETLMNSLRSDVSKAGLQLANFLIIDQPEFFYTTDIKLNKRFFSYALDLKMDKMAVPAYDIFLEEGADSLAGLQRIMQAYPYEWNVTEPGTEETDLRLKQGNQYVLLYLHTSTANIRRFLNYGANDDIPLELQADVNDDRSVYKFYIRHIYTGDVYTGTHWDAASTWQEALSNHIQYLRKEQAASIK